MRSETGCRIYEMMAVRGLAEGLVRPGGLMITERAVGLTSLTPDARVLDIGCGAGTTVRYLRNRFGLRAVGVDPSSLLLRKGLKKDEDLHVLRGSAEHLPVGDAVLDGILAECSLSVTDDVHGVLGECARVLKRGGWMMVHDLYVRNPDRASDLKGLPVRSCVTGAATGEEWIERFESCGLRVVGWEDHSQALKEFAAQLILLNGSLEGIFCCSGDRSVDGGRIGRALARARPGYFLLIARKVGV